jgi:hypothetical protein
MLMQSLRQHNGGTRVAGPVRGHVGVAERLHIVVFKQGGTVDHGSDGAHLLNHLRQEGFCSGFVGQIGLENTQAGVCGVAIQDQAILGSLQRL